MEDMIEKLKALAKEFMSDDKYCDESCEKCLLNHDLIERGNYYNNDRVDLCEILNAIDAKYNK